MEGRGASGSLALEALIALDTAVCGVAGLALLVADLDTIDTAVARVDEL